MSLNTQTNKYIIGVWGFPGGSAGKKPLANARHTGSIPGSRRSPGVGNGNHLLGKSRREETGGLESMGSQRVEDD